MDIPIITNQWWSAYISAKQLSARYFEVMAEHGYPENSCKYCSLGLACTLANDPATAPWGGLPTPTVLVARLTCDCIQHVFGQWADAIGSDLLPDGSARLGGQGPGLVPPFQRRLGTGLSSPTASRMLVDEMHDLIALLEQRTGRRFDEDRLVHLMERINEQEGYLWEATQAIGQGAALPGLDRRADAQHDDRAMASRLGLGRGACQALPRRGDGADRGRARAPRRSEKIRLMWIGAGVWHDPGFYQALEERLGAVFVWSMYMPFSGPAIYPRRSRTARWRRWPAASAR